jgi:hypothetical protein
MTFFPNLYLIGGMRCGSTTLNLILGQHPEIFMSPVKEPMFWVAEAHRSRGTDPASRMASKYIAPGAYAGLFAEAGTARWIGEASHYLYHPKVPELLADKAPEARVIVVLRDPTERLFSEYLNRRRGGHYDGSFDDYMGDEGRFWAKTRGDRPAAQSDKLNKGMQAKLLRPWIETLGPDRVYCLLFDDLQRDPAGAAARIFEWLGVDTGFEPVVVHTQRGGVAKRPGVMKLLNSQKGALRWIKARIPRIWRERLRARVYASTLERPKMSPDTKRALRDIYFDDVAALERLIGRDLSAWKAPSATTGPDRA